MTTTFDPLAAPTSTPQPGHSVIHIGEADAHDRSLTGHGLCGSRISRTATPIGNGQLCVVCEDLAGNDWTEPSDT
jgi:hypothetical protein